MRPRRSAEPKGLPFGLPSGTGTEKPPFGAAYAPPDATRQPPPDASGREPRRAAHLARGAEISTPYRSSPLPSPAAAGHDAVDEQRRAKRAPFWPFPPVPEQNGPFWRSIRTAGRDAADGQAPNRATVRRWPCRGRHRASPATSWSAVPEQKGSLLVLVCGIGTKSHRFGGAFAPPFDSPTPRDFRRQQPPDATQAEGAAPSRASRAVPISC